MNCEVIWLWGTFIAYLGWIIYLVAVLRYRHTTNKSSFWNEFFWLGEEFEPQKRETVATFLAGGLFACVIWYVSLIFIVGYVALRLIQKFFQWVDSEWIKITFK
jgi:hypothetical protein